MHKAFKYRVYPTKEQEKILNEWQGQLRFIWNQFLDGNIKRYEKEKKFNFKFEMANALPKLKQEAGNLGADAITNLQSDATDFWKKLPSQKIIGNAYVRTTYTAQAIVWK